MKKTDYQTLKQAQNYHSFRFSKGLSIIDQNETEIINLLAKTLPLSKPIIIDLAAGTGRITKKLLSLNPKKIYAIDSSKSMLSKLSQNLKSSIIQIVNHPAQNTKLPAKTANLIITFHFLKHLPKQIDLFKEVHRLLKPKGYFIFDVLNQNSLAILNLSDCYAVSEIDIINLLKKNNFRIIKIIHLHFLGETIYKLFGQKIGHFFNRFDKILSNLNLKFSTKIIICAQKI